MREGTKQVLAVLGILFVTAIWGSTFIFIKWTVVQLDVYYFVFLRFAIATAIMAILFWKQLKKIDLATLKAGVMLGILLAIIYIAQTEGLRFTSASNSAQITCLFMVLVPIFSRIYPGERSHWLTLAGIALAVPGTFMLTHFSLSGINVGDIVTGLVPIAGAWHIIFTTVYGRRHKIVPLVVIQFACVTVVSGIIMLIRGNEYAELPKIAWLTLFITSILGTCIAFIIVVAAQRIIDSSRAGVIFAMEAVFAMLFAWWLGGETMTRLSFIGACLMISGMVISEFHPLVKKIII